MKRRDVVRRLSWTGVVGGALGVALGLKDMIVGPRVPDTQLSYPAAPDEVWWTACLLVLVHAGAAAGTWGVRRSDATNGKAAGALATSAVAFAVMIPAELAFIPLRDAQADSAVGVTVGGVLGAAALISGIGLILAGVHAVRERRWSGWRRYAILAAGLWPVAVVTPVFIASGWAAWPLAGAELFLLGMSAAAIAEVPNMQDAPSAEPAPELLG